MGKRLSKITKQEMYWQSVLTFVSCPTWYNVFNKSKTSNMFLVFIPLNIHVSFPIDRERILTQVGQKLAKKSLRIKHAQTQTSPALTMSIYSFNTSSRQHLQAVCEAANILIRPRRDNLIWVSEDRTHTKVFFLSANPINEGVL